jgi:hypothetical protein
MKPFIVARIDRIYWVLVGARCRWTTNLREAFSLAEALQ